MTFTEELEIRFGSDEALGVCFITDDGVELSLDEFNQMYAELGDDMPGCQSFFPDGTSAICCTDYARQISMGLPGRVQIFGFANEDNPTSRVARDKLHPGGHDFAVVDDRYVVDPWIRLVLCEKGPIVFDMQDELEAAQVLDTYGPRTCWKNMSEVAFESLPKPSFKI